MTLKVTHICSSVGDLQHCNDPTTRTEWKLQLLPQIVKTCFDSITVNLDTREKNLSILLYLIYSQAISNVTVV